MCLCPKARKTMLTHRKKLSHLTKNKALPFTHNETVTNLSSHQSKDEELELFKNGLDFSIKALGLSSTNILTTFERIHQTIKHNIRNQEDYTHLKTELAHIAHSYIMS